MSLSLFFLIYIDSTDCKVYAVDQDPTAYEKALQMADMDAYRWGNFSLNL